MGESFLVLEVVELWEFLARVRRKLNRMLRIPKNWDITLFPWVKTSNNLQTQRMPSFSVYRKKQKGERTRKGLHGIRRQIIETQNGNWCAIEKQFNVFQQNIHEMRSCDQLLYTRQQVKFNFVTISSLLSLIYSNVKSYRAALSAFQMNIMNAVPSLLTQYVPMSLLLKESLESFLQQLATEHLQSRDWLTLLFFWTNSWFTMKRDYCSMS